MLVMLNVLNTVELLLYPTYLPYFHILRATVVYLLDL